MKNILRYGLLGLALFCLAGCTWEYEAEYQPEKEYESYDDSRNPGDDRPFLRLRASTLPLPNAVGESASMEFESNRTASVTLPPGTNWVSVVVDNQTKTLTATANTLNESESPRRVDATLATDAGTVALTIIQLPEASVSLTPDMVTLGYAAGSTESVAIITNSSSSSRNFSIPEDAQDWLHGTISGNVLTLSSLTQNESDGEYTTTVTVTVEGVSVPLPVTQEKKPPGIAVNDVFYEGETAVGIVWKIDDAYYYLISLGNPVGLKWALLNSAVLTAEGEETDTSSSSDGEYNTAKIMALEGTANAAVEGGVNSYPAVKYCADLGSGWYMPANDEINDLGKATQGASPYDAAPYPLVVSEDAQAAGADPFATHYHWTSTQHATVTTSVAARTMVGKSRANDKARTDAAVRCMRKVAK